MESDQLNTTLVFTIDDVELYVVNEQGTTLVERGPLNVLYILSYNCFVIHINEFNYHLSKEIEVKGIPAKGDEQYPSYTLPNIEGHYIVKILQIAGPEALSSFETVLSTHCTLHYETLETETQQGTAETRGPNQEEHKNEGEVGLIGTAKEGEQKTKTQIASNVILTGGELARAGMLKSAEIISSGIASLGDYLQNNVIQKGEEKSVKESTMNKLKSVNSTTERVFTISRVQAENIITKGKAIGAVAAAKLQSSKIGQKFENHEHHDTAVTLGKSTLIATTCFFDGAVGALSTLGRGLADTVTKLVEHKYGEKVADATKEGLNSIGNVSIVADGCREGAQKVIEDTRAEKKI